MAGQHFQQNICSKCNKQCFHTLLLPLRAQISATFPLVIQHYVLQFNHLYTFPGTSEKKERAKESNDSLIQVTGTLTVLGNCS